MLIALVPFALKPDVSEDALLDLSERFEKEFVAEQDGIVRRVLLKDGDSYADLVFFRDQESIDRVMEAERTSPVCAEFFSAMASDGSYRLYQVLKSYD
ncbi:hypothetical protein [Jiangella anatolica]|uniref:ABM domain-containing protein n=1 Tax=Jiangella anatolica TaxID=2670374 RepID=A0A2W2B789_9ACTN|nr:hypothetical protein [Jiangella anatolica]PZF83331.1 hypothetical protein C1I92_12865 [Jiangella anatolica]